MSTDNIEKCKKAESALVEISRLQSPYDLLHAVRKNLIPAMIDLVQVVRDIEEGRS